LFKSDKPGRATFRRTPAGLQISNRQDNRAEPKLVSAVVSCAVPGLSDL